MTQKQTVHVALLGAAPFEIEALLMTLEPPIQQGSLLGHTYNTGRLNGVCALVGTTGIGKVNAAATTAAMLERFRIGSIWNVGCAGAYPQSPLSVGDVLISTSTLCGDEGVLTSEGILSSRVIGIPLASQGSETFFDAFPLHSSWAYQKAAAFTPAGRYLLSEGVLHGIPRELSWEGDCFGSLAAGGSFQIVHGPSLTVGMSSGDAKTARSRFERYGAFAENMEGSAVAQTCLRYGVSFLECRGMSNVAGDREKSHWRLREAMDHCHGVARAWLAGFSEAFTGQNLAEHCKETVPLPGKGAE